MDEKKMAFPSALHQHGKKYRAKLRIPKAASHQYPGQSVLIFTTGETDKPAIKALYLRWLAEREEEFQRVRETGSRYKSILPPEVAASLVRRMVSSVLGADEDARLSGELLTDFGYEHHAREFERHSAEVSRFVARGGGGGDVAMAASDWLSSEGYALAPESAEFNAFAHKFARALAEAVEMRRSREAGKWVETPAPDLPASISSGVPLLSVLVKDFLSRQDDTAQMYKKYRATLELFLAYIGDRPGHTLKQRELEDFFACLCRLPPHWKKESKALSVREIAAKEWPQTLHLNTVEKTYRPALRLFLEDCQRVYHDEAPQFPQGLTVRGIKYSGSRTDPEGHQRALRPDELKRLFEGAEYRAFAADPDKAHCYWLPLVGLFTGARVNEVCQLHPLLDIEEEEGVWRFNFTEDTETDERVSKAVKNAPSRRRVPIHPRLLALGFLDYLKIVRERKASLLFHQFPPKAGRASGIAQEWFRELIRGAGLRDETPGKRIVGFHCFRSTMTTAGSRVHLPWPIQNIIGHAIPGRSIETEGYIDGELPLAEKVAIFRCIDFAIDPPRPSKEAPPALPMAPL